MIYIKERV